MSFVVTKTSYRPSRSRTCLKTPKSFKICTYTVGTYSSGNSFLVYTYSKQVLPTIPSPTTVIFNLFVVPMVRAATSDKPISPQNSRFKTLLYKHLKIIKQVPHMEGELYGFVRNSVLDCSYHGDIMILSNLEEYSR